jgi:hypothetical protein
MEQRRYAARWKAIVDTGPDGVSQLEAHLGRYLALSAKYNDYAEAGERNRPPCVGLYMQVSALLPPIAWKVANLPLCMCF